MPSMLGCLEIFTNPRDLEIMAGECEGDKRLALLISRGPGHNFKPIVSSKPFAESRDKVADKIKEILDTVAAAVTKELENPNSFASRYLNPESRRIDPVKVLNPGLIAWIVGEIREGRSAGTYKLTDAQIRRFASAPAAA